MTWTGPPRNIAPEKFKPFVTGEERIGSYIRVGGSASTPYWNGMLTAARNFNHLLAFSRKPLIEQHGSATIAWTSNPNKPFASYVIRMPNLHDRKTVRVEVTATTGGGASQFKIFGTLEGQLTFNSSLTASGSTATVDVSYVDGSFYDVLTLGFTLDFAGTITITDVRAYSAPDAVSSGEATLTTTKESQDSWAAGDRYQTPVYTPQDTDTDGQYIEDAPLSVAMMSDLMVGLQGMYRDNMGALVNWAWWGDRAAYVTTTAGLSVSASIGTSPVAVAQYIYYPRPGVKYLTAFIQGHTDGYVSAAATIQIDWKGNATRPVAPIAVATTDVDREQWAIWEYNIPVPDNAGPIYLEVRARGSTDGACIIQGVSIYENPEEVV